VNAEFSALAVTAALNPNLLAVGPLIENRQLAQGNGPGR